MGYRKIPNLYKDIRILDFKECYALEKVHGTSAHITYSTQELCAYGKWTGNNNGFIAYFSGGAKYETFVKLFNLQELLKKFVEVGCPDVTVYGEAYGGKMQGMRDSYGDELKFIAFEVKIGDVWLDVMNAADVVAKLGLEFVPFNRGPATLEWINEQKYKGSEVAIRNGIGVRVMGETTFIEKNIMREGVVIRPIKEYVDYRGNRVITKHKNDEFMETKTKRKVDPDKLKVLEKAREIADEWVTPMRLQHVLDKMPEKGEMKHVPLVIKAMIEDVKTESEGEVVWSKDVEKCIGRNSVKLYKDSISLIKDG